jgi:hypothetical protein
MAASTKEYELTADRLSLVTSKPGDPLEYEDHVKGDKVSLTEARAKELIAAGAVKDPDASDDAGEPGGQTEAPEGKAPGVGDTEQAAGDAGADEGADEGSIGDGGPDPQGTGSTVVGDGGGAGDAQGSVAATPSSTPRKRGGR